MSPEPADQHPPLTSPGRLQKIDQLRERNVGAYLPLPQLVAVGDQSSGKSSLLESLTGIPFPRGPDLCTRYTTQITHRREAQQRIDITIIPGPYASQQHQTSFGLYHKQVQTTAQLRTGFPEILAQVNALMGIKPISNTAGDNTFSGDILKIEKCGPSEDYLTIIDVPGIFRITTEGDSRTVILAVLPSNVDVATQEILALAEEADPAGDRTLGILTKADLLKERSARLAVASLVEGKRKPLKLGYHLITNRGGDDHGEERDALAALREPKAIFQEQPWDNLPRDRYGIYPLRERLEDLLGEITDRALAELRSETRQKLANAEKKLKDLGAPRQTEREQQQFLVGIASDFQSLVRAALDANYSAHPAFESNMLRLITAIINTTDQFNVEFDKYARTYLFESEPQVEILVPVKLATLVSPVLSTEEGEEEDDGEAVSQQSHSPHPSIYPYGTRGRLCRHASAPKGRIGHPKRPLRQSWRPDPRNATSMARNEQFYENPELVVVKGASRRVKESTRHCRYSPGSLPVLPPCPSGAPDGAPPAHLTVVPLNDVADAVTNKSNTAYATETIHDTLEAYYKVAYKRFVDNVFRQAVVFQLLSGPKSPLRLFSEQWVLDLGPEMLHLVAGESTRTRDHRERLKKEIRDLGIAMEILR
ncbi:dynamin family protein [Colletotrichum salicis]|uniref:Dynamin family protein n=1 Tax=Colletotrichum salicis TaxID=1209931 RepID=A0A135V6H3_9PEZI|nr:dynamin family protein [Colletotrichum salicis]